MKLSHYKKPRRALLAILAAVSIALLVGAGCGGPQSVGDSTNGTAPSGKTGAQLWVENCQRCHELRPPNLLSPEQWDVAVTHMRVRAALYGRDADKIKKFLQSGM